VIEPGKVDVAQTAFSAINVPGMDGQSRSHASIKPTLNQSNRLRALPHRTEPV
jgi:hypothetical protein